MRKQTNRGYSLVEVLIAIAITGIVLLTIVTLFYMGRRNVYSGKQMTYAVSAGTRIMEDLSTAISDDVLTSLNIDDATVPGTVTLCNNKVTAGVCSGPSVTFANSLNRDTDGCAASSTPPPLWTCANDNLGYLAAYKELVTASGGEHGKLANATVGFILTPRNPAVVGEPWTSARFLRIRAYVAWDEASNRRRIAFFDTTKVNRE